MLMLGLMSGFGLMTSVRGASLSATSIRRSEQSLDEKLTKQGRRVLHVQHATSTRARAIQKCTMLFIR
eukprot:4088554-Pleurochrysis_carterae.AAC.1